MAALFHPAPEQFQIENVLTALGNPTRLQVVRELADDTEHACGTLAVNVAKSTMTHHWRVLREAGVVRQDPSGRELMLTLRRREIDARFPGLLDSILLAAAEAAGACAAREAEEAAAEVAAVTGSAAPNIG